MAISYTAHRGSASAVATNSSIAMNPSANLVVGKLIVVRTYSRGETSHTVTDSKGNTWVKVAEIQGATGSTKTLALHYTVVTTQIDTTDTITLTLGGAQTGKVIAAEEYATGGGTVSVVGSNTAEGSSGTPLATLSGLSSLTRMWVGVLGVSQRITLYTYTQDSDYANDTKVGTNDLGGYVSTDMGSRSAAITSDSFNPTITSNPWGIILAAFEEAAPVAVTPTTAALTATAYIPRIATAVTPSTLALVTESFGPVIASYIIPGPTALTITLFASDIGAQTVTPNTTALVLTAYAPVIVAQIVPGTATLVLSVLPPIINLAVVPGAATLVLTTFALQIARPVVTTGQATFRLIATGDAHV